MFVPSAKSKISLIVLLIVALALFYWVENSRNFVSDDYYQDKLEAAELMQQAEELIKEYRTAQGIYVDEVNDPNRTSLIGEKQSAIVTDRGDLTAKLTSLNPNFAALIVDLFKEANLRPNDKIAINVTGSYPALNIAVLSAAKVLELEVVMISSVGPSMFGATDPDFTWLDMERLLNENDIFPYRSIAASIGGGRDLGRGLNKLGRDLILENIEKNNVILVQEKTLEENIAKKMELFMGDDPEAINLYVNIGGGLSSLGISLSGELIDSGFHRYLSLTNIPLKGTLLLFAERGVPIIHLLDVIELAEKYNLPLAPEPLPKPGIGSMFEKERYDLTITITAFIILLILILIVIFFDKKELKLEDDEINV